MLSFRITENALFKRQPTPAVLVHSWEQQTTLSAHSSSRSIIARLFLVTSSSQFPEDPLGRCFTWKLLGKISSSHTPHSHVPSRLQVLIVSKMMSGSMHYDRSLLSLLLAFASGTPPAVAARTRFPVPPQVAQVAQVAQAELAERVVAEGRRAAGCGEWARAVGAAVGAAPVAEAPAASEAPEASAASAAAASPSEASEAPAALPSRASLSGTSWVKQEWAEAARAERAGCVRRAGSSRTASSGPARCSWETAEDSPAWARWARRWEP